MESIKQVEIEAIRNKKKVTGKDGKEKNQDYLPYTYLMTHCNIFRHIFEDFYHSTKHKSINFP